ncbi:MULTISPECIES: hypothetical protein [unclassified Bradyrhizobium]|uniref:hypothetical protein n=1 Tax=unclassified Bradyrhizobium TaxID=2631580 RepID=UPI00247AEC50|nr:MULTISPECIES: hypothetical protein [unclassified Bradyrhizobium]WGR73307.1 hypothetical protein MTX24_11010 [Bradyrhizobium sp. ISRA426]WGR78144.1 hypothetical protein MTX21_35980 [Bradyrhizobium sp. ISRA430]WGR88545.1 hypothetical protein MTX25_11020 [Bradyrhizobium sp. ISRA432]
MAALAMARSMSHCFAAKSELEQSLDVLEAHDAATKMVVNPQGMAAGETDTQPIAEAASQLTPRVLSRVKEKSPDSSAHSVE